MRVCADALGQSDSPRRTGRKRQRVAWGEVRPQARRLRGGGPDGRRAGADRPPCRGFETIARRYAALPRNQRDSLRRALEAFGKHLRREISDPPRGGDVSVGDRRSRPRSRGGPGACVESEARPVARRSARSWPGRGRPDCWKGVPPRSPNSSTRFSGATCSSTCCWASQHGRVPAEIAVRAREAATAFLQMHPEPPSTIGNDS